MFRAKLGKGTAGSDSTLLLSVPFQSVGQGAQSLNISSGGSPSATPSLKSQVPDPAYDIFREALEIHKLGLSPHQQDLFLGASAVGLMDIVKDLDQQHTVGSRTRGSIVKAQGFLQVVDGYLNVLGICIQHSPQYSALVVGGLKLFVDVSRNAVFVVAKLLIYSRLGGNSPAFSTSLAKRWRDSVAIWNTSPSMRSYTDTMRRLRRQESL